MKQFAIITLDNSNSSFQCRAYERYRYRPNFIGHWHAHAFAEIFFITDGKGFFYTDEETYPIQRGMIVINNGNVKHMESSHPSSELEYAVFGIDDVSFYSNDTGNETQTFVFDFRRQFETVFDFLRQIEHEWIEREEFWQCAVQTHFNSFILYVIRHSKLFALPVQSVLRPSLMASVHTYLTANYADDISLDLLAEQFCVNKYYLAHTFKKVYGDTIISTLNKIRCQTAKHLLQNFDYSISEIAISVGFNSSSYFSKIYRKIIGETPQQSRKKGAAH